MSNLRRLLCVVLCVGTMAISGQGIARAADQQVPREHLQLWDAFNHYVRVARPDLARDAWTRLSNMVDDAQLLRVAEQSPTYRDDWTRTLDIAARIPELRDSASDIIERLHRAQMQLSRDPDRIQDAIRKLDQGTRPNANARLFLRESGQFAVPQMIAHLRNSDHRSLHPHILTAFRDIGREAVYPLCVALLGMEELQQGQIAQVLAELGYPAALPFLKQVIEDPNTAAGARQRAQIALQMLARTHRVSDTTSAAELYLALGRELYQMHTQQRRVDGYDSRAGLGMVWNYERRRGLYPTQVPAEIHGDVRAMDAAARALKLAPSMDQALSLFLAANARRELRLPEGARDASYALSQGARFYLNMAGAARQHDVLHTALRDNDVQLALVAIRALGDTGGIDQLINTQQPIQPLLEAMSHPNRRVRIEAVFAVAHSRPTKEFEGALRVMPVLQEAVRQAGVRYAMVIADSQERRNELAGLLDSKGYNIIQGASVAALYDAIATTAGIDVMVVDGTAAQLAAAFDTSVEDYRLASVPLLAIGDLQDLGVIRKRYMDAGRLFPVERARGEAALSERITAALEYTQQGEIDQDIADDYALRALDLLESIAQGGSLVFDVSTARIVLEEAVLQDPRERVVMRAAQVLALLNHPSAQQTLARAALGQGRDGELLDDVRVSLLNSVAASANFHGNLITQEQLQALVAFTKENSGPDGDRDLAVAAARAVGALLPPTSELVNMVAGQ